MTRLVWLLLVCACREPAPAPDAGVFDAGLVDAGLPDAGAVDAGPNDPCRSFAMPSLQAFFTSPRRVFAHYFQPFPLSIDNQPSSADYYQLQYLAAHGENDRWLGHGGYLRARPLSVPVGTGDVRGANFQREIRLAMAAGITGFTYDLLEANEVNAGSRYRLMLDAAAAVDPRFVIIPMPDLGSLGTSAQAQQQIAALLRVAAAHPASLRRSDGRLVVAAFVPQLPPPPRQFWRDIFDDLATSGITVAFVPTLLDWSQAATLYAGLVDGFGDWGTATPGAAQLMADWPAKAHDAGVTFWSPVGPQQYRPKDFLYWEAENTAAFRTAWMSAIDGGADVVQLVTWNDLSESSQVAPVTDATLRGDLGVGFYSLTAYYAAWFQTGRAPPITHDALFFFHRREPVGAANPAQSQATTANLLGGGPGVDRLEVLSLLTAPGEVSLTLGGTTDTRSQAAGLTSWSVPLRPGIPHFSLRRDGGTVFGFDGPLEIFGDAGLPDGRLDLTYWSGSGSATGRCVVTP